MLIRISWALLLGATVAGCGNYTLPGEAAPTGGGGGAVVNTKNCDELFAFVQPRLEFCRNCHVPGGIADVDDGRAYMLSSDRAQDRANFEASWERLGRNDNGKSRILKMASGTDTRSHTGGSPWPVGSDTYRAVDALLLGFVDPAACVLSNLGGNATDQFPLLGSKRGGHLWSDFCEGKADDVVPPDDPRTLVVPGVNQGKAVYMNAFWQTCQEGNKPATCGEQRARVARGYSLVAGDGEVGAGSFFSGDMGTGGFAFPAADYNTLWDVVMNLPSRPDNFDQLVAERWGTPLSATPNPYPLPGEDPNSTDGGSGQLPTALTQLRNADGTWTGMINVTCSSCHGGQVGEVGDGERLGPQYGTNSVSDITVMFTDLSKLAPAQSALAVISQNKVRGTGNITNFQLFGTLLLSEVLTDANQLVNYLSIQTQPSTGTEDPPVWWNLGSRSMKFFDGGQVSDSQRIELSFYMPGVPMHGSPPNSTMEQDKQWILDHMHDGDAWILSLKSPPWPEARLGAIDVALAEQGAILFHSKNLWEASLNNPSLPPPGGNGSCAGCHGAYSPRYVNDPAYLDTPLLEGVAAHVVPIDVIGTDRRRLDGHSLLVALAARDNWYAYNDGPRNEQGIPLCASQHDPAVRGDRELGYLAPPLYGVWATAPYFHNGAVPNIWEVLQPADRKTIWRRWSSEPREDQAGQVVMGFRSDLEAYDAQNLGWKYDAFDCGAPGTTPVLDCNPVDEDLVTVQDGLALVWGNGGLAWNLLNVPIMNDAMIEDRKIYNTKYYSQSNAGHAFTSVLTDAERRALIEYMKTL